MSSTDAIDGRLVLLRTAVVLFSGILAALCYPSLWVELVPRQLISLPRVIIGIFMLEAHGIGLLWWLVTLAQRRRHYSDRRLVVEATVLALPVVAGVMVLAYNALWLVRALHHTARPYVEALLGELIQLGRSLLAKRPAIATPSPLDRALPTLLRRVAFSRLYDGDAQRFYLVGPDHYPARYHAVAGGPQERLRLECETKIEPYHLYCGHPDQLRGLSTRQVLELADAWELAIIECDLGRGILYPANKLGWINVYDSTRTTPRWLRRLKNCYDWQAGRLEYMTGQLYFIHDGRVKRGNYGQLIVRGVQGAIDRDLGFFAIDNGRGGWDFVTRDLDWASSVELVHSLSPDFIAARGTPWQDPLAAEREHLDQLVLHAYRTSLRRGGLGLTTAG